MRTLLVLSAAVLGACLDAKPPEGVTPGDFVVPTARPTQVEGQTFTGNADLVPACLTRYVIAGIPGDVECHTAFVDGNPLHYLTTCPAVHAMLATTHEVEFDGNQRLQREVQRFPGPGGAAYQATSYHYDEQGRLTEIDRDTDADGAIDATLSFGDRDADGDPRSASVTNKPWQVDRIYPETTRSVLALQYDSDGRLIVDQARLVTGGSLYYDRSIVYDDGARRRSSTTIIDLGAVVPGAGGPGYNTAYDLFDADRRLIESGWTTPGGPSELMRLRYDEHGRRLTTVLAAAALSYTAHEIYDCP